MSPSGGQLDKSPVKVRDVGGVMASCFPDIGTLPLGKREPQMGSGSAVRTGAPGHPRGYESRGGTQPWAPGEASWKRGLPGWLEGQVEGD